MFFWNSLAFSMMWLSANINIKSYSKKLQAIHIQRVTPLLVVRGFQCNLILYLKEIQHSQKHGCYTTDKANNIFFHYCFYFLIHSLSFFTDYIKNSRWRFKRERAYAYLWLIHVDVGQKPAQYCKAIILLLKIKKNLKIHMERYSMFLGLKNQHCENAYTIKCNLQIQCDHYQITNGIFHKTRTKNIKDSEQPKQSRERKMKLRESTFLTSDYIKKLQLARQYGTGTKTDIQSN